MIEILKELILNAQAEKLFTGTTRKLGILQVGKKASILSGLINIVLRKLRIMPENNYVCHA